MTVSPAGSPAVSSITVTTPAPAQGVQSAFTLGVPRGVTGGTFGPDPHLAYTAVMVEQGRDTAAAQLALAARAAIATALGANASNITQRQNLAARNGFLQGEITAKKQLAADQKQLQEDIDAGAPQATLDADQAAIDADKKNIQTPNVPVAQDEAEKQANQNQINVLENEFANGVGQAVNEGLERVAKALRAAGVSDRELNNQFAELHKSLKDFLHSAENRAIAHFDSQMDGTARANIARFSALLTVDDLVRNVLATGEPLAVDPRAGRDSKDTEKDKKSRSIAKVEKNSDTKAGETDAGSTVERIDVDAQEAGIVRVDARAGLREETNESLFAQSDVDLENNPLSLSSSGIIEFTQRAQALLASLDQILQQLGIPTSVATVGGGSAPGTSHPVEGGGRVKLVV